ncbi:MAG: DUF4397 domain-containing protein [Armatimonadota bacterium]|nr:DUF4397 domain-containing protein [Armatimonadota bacterium]
MTRDLRLVQTTRQIPARFRCWGRWKGLAPLAGALLLAGCGIGGNSNNVAVRMVDALPSTTNLDITANGGAFVSAIPYGSITTYGFVTTGDNQLLANAAGTTTAIIPTVTLRLTGGVYTIIASGITGNTLTPPTFFAVPDDNTSPPKGMIRVRVFNLSPDAGPVDVSIGSQVIATSAAYPIVPVATTAGTYLTVNPNTVKNSGTNNWTITVRPAGSTTLLATRMITALDSDHVFSFFVEGQLANNTITMVPQEDT